ncbi:hypothetical protein [Streptococcus dysgalactiae]|uniref:Phage protein n=1 Tax=Streptococcus dysgalactiae TaxID=1334 RepID=A0ABU0A700_STRDY|nr:hypothetical protein [Streptococcus dysgalactiae]EGL48927.1 hypothetical protein HMPREF9964_0075 [Streptococcus dysgalactiae subsp. equisimilis SK1249]MDQ0263065.1 hypothetical protein [Streptococcus dysgalactiae]QQC56030.1 hypothetical protein I6H73_03295 [Streptococcus dysgalactiae]SUN70603.1 Uncharacterised protein [Streptococcus dysgalactiae]
MVKKPVKRTGYTKNTPKSYLINAGAVYKNLAWNQEKTQWEGELLGATSDGNKLKIEQKYRTIEVDGVFVPAVGQKVLESQSASLEINMKELTAENLRLAINGSLGTGDGKTSPSDYKVIGGKGKLENTDYITNIGLVATLSGTNKPVIVILDNALCTSGLEFDTKDNDEAVVTMTFEAHANEEQIDDLTLPCRIYYPEVSLEV